VEQTLSAQKDLNENKLSIIHDFDFMESPYLGDGVMDLSNAELENFSVVSELLLPLPGYLLYKLGRVLICQSNFHLA
jgi:hypothetical protein